jgi:hypothetical protein
MASTTRRCISTKEPLTYLAKSATDEKTPTVRVAIEELIGGPIGLRCTFRIKQPKFQVSDILK